ncbi:hypothetical protein HELRODRAFT_158980 [Helobdella robusta]|uniref:Uncharacterized protein n=1 Tax=Helobdella robusta TaxID=6412 RepID=T1ENG2_HELRO|nr:hypothetical protein HELRODRAFT_158980 [Helobdella robusta]ESO12446.1 hypothetical protein HELRODRAFT_158980 [Helobdella robusta]
MSLIPKHMITWVMWNSMASEIYLNKDELNIGEHLFFTYCVYQFLQHLRCSVSSEDSYSYEPVDELDLKPFGKRSLLLPQRSTNVEKSLSDVCEEIYEIGEPIATEALIDRKPKPKESSQLRGGSLSEENNTPKSTNSLLFKQLKKTSYTHFEAKSFSGKTENENNKKTPEILSTANSLVLEMKKSFPYSKELSMNKTDDLSNNKNSCSKDVDKTEKTPTNSYLNKKESLRKTNYIDTKKLYPANDKLSVTKPLISGGTYSEKLTIHSEEKEKSVKFNSLEKSKPDQSSVTTDEEMGWYFSDISRNCAEKKLKELKKV